LILEKCIEEDLETIEKQMFWRTPDSRQVKNQTFVVPYSKEVASEGHQTLKNEDSRKYVKFFVFRRCLYQTHIIHFLHFWSCVDTKKERQGQIEWTNNSSFCKGFSNVFSTTLSKSRNIPTLMINLLKDSNYAPIPL
jgi:hypothetical protein